MTTRKLVLAASRTAQTAEELGRRFARELAQVLKDTERRLRPLLRDVTEDKRTAIVRASQANKVRVGIRDALAQGGFQSLTAGAYGEGLDELTARVLASRRLASASAELTAGAAQKLDALKALYASDLLDEGEHVARELWKATVRGVFGSRSPERILADLAGVLDDRQPHLQTLYDTSVSIYGRQVEALQAGDDPDTTFAYMGPVDERTRDFCLTHVGKVYTRAEIDDLDNGQLDNVFMTGGGWNCRHVWTEVSWFSALQDLGAGRVPEVQDQLDALDEAA